jgi:hypothetical protein
MSEYGAIVSGLLGVSGGVTVLRPRPTLNSYVVK